MKSIIVLTLITLSLIYTKNLQKPEDLNYKPQKAVNPREVKSPGEFSNIAPDATQVVRPKYANPHLQVVMNIEKFRTPVQKTEWHGSTSTPKNSIRTDLAGHLFEKQGYIDWDTNAQSNRMMLTTTTEPMKTNTIHPVMLDLDNNKAKVVQMPNKYKDPKGLFGTH
mmetsp:Transcript_2175/g.2238  ORF Transcript_2175/g.2238 Transcript_2175/m.2238 type:complete len:166 (+) Transcript_2175:28-525(+)